MANKREREEKFKPVMVRFPVGRASELEEAANESGLAMAVFVKVELLKILDARKLTAAGTVPPAEQPTTVNF